MKYYENQLKKLTDWTDVTIKLSDFDGNSTNNMSLNLESIQVLRGFLNDFERSLKNKNCNADCDHDFKTQFCSKCGYEVPF